jgi:hypothetical protein
MPPTRHQASQPGQAIAYGVLAHHAPSCARMIGCLEPMTTNTYVVSAADVSSSALVCFVRNSTLRRPDCGRRARPPLCFVYLWGTCGKRACQPREPASRHPSPNVIVASQSARCVGRCIADDDGALGNAQILQPRRQL